MNNAPFDVLLFGLLEAEYLLGLDAAPNVDEPRIIEREVRRAGGNALRCARLLSHWGARVCLMGNPLADDSNGRLIARELEAMPIVMPVETPLVAPSGADYETPYSVICLARDGSRTVLTRHQHAQRFDRLNGAVTVEEIATPGQSSRDSFNSAAHMSTHAWPRARLAGVCGDHLPCASLDLARAMKTRDVPLFAFDAKSLSGLAEVAIFSASQAAEENQKFNPIEAPVRGLNRAAVMEIEKNIKCNRSDAGARTLVLPSAEKNAGDDLLAREGSESVFFAGLLWARLEKWEWERGWRFAATAWSLALDSTDAMPSLGQIEAVSQTATGAENRFGNGRNRSISTDVP